MIATRLAFACLAAGASLIGPAPAAYPERPITVIIPFTSGGGTDIGGRTWARALETCLGGEQGVVVVNKPGAGGQIGFAEIASATPDGYTIGALNVPNIQIGAITRPDAGFKLDSFDYLGTLYASRTTLSVLKESPYKDMKQLLAEARSSGQPVTVGISGIGSDDHLLTLKLKKATGVEFKSIPFGDSAGTNLALLGGHIGIATLNITTAAKNSDKVRALAVAAEAPSADLPGAPTFRQLGWDIVNGTTHVIGAPKGLPADVKAKLTGCFDTMAADPAFTAEVTKQALIPTPMNTEATARFVQEEYATLKAIWDSEPWE